MFFRDGVRRIDFVLSYTDDKDGEKKQVTCGGKLSNQLKGLVSVLQGGTRGSEKHVNTHSSDSSKRLN